MIREKINMYKAILFDFDFTLGDSSKGIIKSANHAITKMGFPPKDDESIRKTIGHTMRDSFRMLTGDPDPEKGSVYQKYFLEMADQVMTASTELYPGVLDSIKAFREAGYKLGIVTTKMSFRINDILKKFSAQELVDVVIGADNVKTEKPDPEGVLIAAKTLGLELSRILYVGDSLVDAKTAANAGVDLAAVLTGTTTREDFAPYAPKFICENIPELRSKLLP